MSPTTRRIVVGATLTVAFAGVGAGVSIAGSPGSPGSRGSAAADDDEAALTGSELERAGRAALEASRAYGEGGRVTGTEGPGEEPHYEVDVTMPDGTQIDYDLDSSFAVVGTPEVEGQDDTGGDDDGTADD